MNRTSLALDALAVATALIPLVRIVHHRTRNDFDRWDALFWFGALVVFVAGLAISDWTPRP